MKIGVFSEIQSGIGGNYLNQYSTQNNVVSSKNAADKKPDEVKSDKKTKKEKAINAVKTVLPIAIPLIAIPVTAAITYKISNKNTEALKKQVEELRALTEKNAQLLSNEIKDGALKNKKANAQIWAALLAIAGVSGSYSAGKLSKEDKAEITQRIKNRVDSMDSRSDYAVNAAEQSLSASGNTLNNKYVDNINGIKLLKNSDSLNKNTQKYNQAIKDIQEAGSKYLFSAPKAGMITSEKPALWSVTSEFAPIKEGGLGSVPVEIQNNVVKLGIELPTFIPMYQQKGIANFKEQNGKYIYTYKNKDFLLEKIASFKVDAYQGNKSKTETVEFYVHNSLDRDGNNKQLVFVKNDNYFNGTIYQTSEKTEEPEKFAFFSKAVYEFAKLKEDINSVKDLKIYNQEALDSISAPDGLILNDWQASPIAALARYKAPMENAYGQLNDDAANKLKNMRIITIGHNAMYQGSTRNNNNDVQRKEATSNILNTLFDEFASDIVANAKSGASESDPSDEGLKNLDNILILNKQDGSANHTNLLNIGICLSDYFHPVSQNYAKEITSGEHPELSGELAWAMTQKDKAGSLYGIINGNDFNNLSIEAKKSAIKNLTGLDFVTYNKSSNISDVMSARLKNKINFYNNYIIPLSKKNDKTNHDIDVENIRKLTSKLELVDEMGNTNLPVLTDEEIANTPIITSVGRLVSQKGIPVMTDAIKMLLDNWEKDFPGKQKPIFYLAGQDGEGGAQRKHIEDLKNKRLSKEDSNRVIFAHGFAPMPALTSASDFFLLPSVFEPCGLTQGEAFAVATPVIGSAVGGIVDTVNRNGKHNGILTDKTKPLTAEAFYKAMKEGLNIYFNEPEKYKQMVNDSLQEDFSWIQKGKQGPVFEYLEKIGFDIDKLPDIYAK